MLGRRRGRAVLTTIALVVATAPAVLAAPPGAAATFPGQNGPIAFARDLDGEGNDDIWLVSPDGTSMVQLTDDPASDTLPAVSPDGSRIAFVSSRSGPYQVYVMGNDGSGVTRLTTEGGWAPTWSPDGTKIVYGSGGDLWVMDADGTDPVQLTDTPDVGEAYPTWSPDGTRIVYSVDAPDQALFVMDADGTDPVLLTDEIGADVTSSWSPDGTRIVFACDAEGLGFPDQLCTIAPDGTQLTVLTELVNADGVAFGVPMEPSWSPDGTKIVFRSTRGIGGQLNVMDADGTNVAQITEHEYGSNWFPSWGTGTSSQTLITGFSPDPPITGIEYAVNGTVTVDPAWPRPDESLPGSVVVTDGAQTCWAEGRPTGTAGVYTFSCTLTAGAPGDGITVTARYSAEPRWAIMPSADDASTAVIEMPGPPTGIRAMQPGPGGTWTVVSWSPPPGPVPNGYQVRCIPLGWPDTTGPGLNPDARWTGGVTSPVVASNLTRGISYRCKVRARYGIFYYQELGDRYEGPLSAWSNTIVVPAIAPPAPLGVRASVPVAPTARVTSVGWNAVPNDTGSPITYTARCASVNGGFTRTATGAAPPLSVTTLSRGSTYRCTVTAKNAVGSATSAPSAAFTVPR